MNWFCVVNPSAGRGGSAIIDVCDVAEALGLEMEIVETTSGSDLKGQVADALDRGFRHIAVAGGDGSAQLALNSIMNAGLDDRCALAIIPVGSGSDFVRTFGHDRGVGPGLERLLEPERYPVDIGRAVGRFGTLYFLNALNLGVAGASARKAANLPRWIGSLRYTIAFWLALGGFRSESITVDVNRNQFEGRAINVVVANGQFFGGGLNIAPRSATADGKMDVQIFSGPRRQAFVIMPRLLFGAHLTHRAVHRYTGSDITLEVPNDWPVEADGEIIGEGSVDIQVIPEAIDFII